MGWSLDAVSVLIPPRFRPCQCNLAIGSKALFCKAGNWTKSELDEEAVRLGRTDNHRLLRYLQSSYGANKNVFYKHASRTTSNGSVGCRKKRYVFNTSGDERDEWLMRTVNVQGKAVSQVIQFSERWAVGTSGNSSGAAFVRTPYRDTGNPAGFPRQKIANWTNGDEDSLRATHSGQFNALYLDGHVELQTLAPTMSDTAANDHWYGWP